MKVKKTNSKIGLTILTALATVFVGCATTELSAPQTEPVAQTDPGVQQGSGSSTPVEEIVVQSANSKRRERYSGRAKPSRVQQLGNVAYGYDADGESEALAFAGDEEIWVIQKPAVSNTDAADSEPGTGSMTTLLDTRQVPLPLRHTDVDAQINGYISTVDVRQQFSNPFDSKIEAVYVFPLPEKAAISEFLMVIGERKIRGILREKEEAKAIYESARSQGYRASLMVQHRPNIFEQRVANIEPGRSIDVEIRYFHTLAYSDGWYSFVFPTVVGPRYNPPGHSDPIPAVGRSSVEKPDRAVSYLRPEERSGHDISIDVSIDAGVVIEELNSTHEIVARREEESAASVALMRQATIPNRDFVLNFKVAGKRMKSNLLTYMDPESQQGYFTMMLYPPEVTDDLARRNMEMVFVIDASGSMSGIPLQQAKDAVSAALDQLQEGDTFQIIRFSDNASQFGRQPVVANRENLKQARRYLKRLNGGGGTQMIEGVRAALDFPHDPSRLRFISFLTDGYIGNEQQILAEIAAGLGSSRIFSFGVGSSVNRFLMERMAKVGKGAVAYLLPQDSGYEVMAGFFGRISHPALTDVRIDWNGMAVSDVYPSVLPDIFVGRPIVVTGKYLGAPSDVKVIGRKGNLDASIRVARSDADNRAPHLAKVWARLRIADLSDRLALTGDPHREFASEIKGVALEHQLMSDYTSFVAVDGSQTTEGDFGTTVHQAVPVPKGVRYETTVEHD